MTFWQQRRLKQTALICLPALQNLESKSGKMIPSSELCISSCFGPCARLAVTVLDGLLLEPPVPL